VKRDLARLKQTVEQEVYARLLPGYVRQFLQRAAPLMGITIQGDLDDVFRFEPAKPGALDFLLPVLEHYLPEQQKRLSVHRPDDPYDAVWLHPGEATFDAFRGYVGSRFARAALTGGVFVDPTASEPYFFHLALVSVERRPDPAHHALAHKETLDCRLIGLVQREGGQIERWPVEHLLLLKGSAGLPGSAMGFAASGPKAAETALEFATEGVARRSADERRDAMMAALPEREAFIRKGYDYQGAELAAARAQLREKAQANDPHAKAALTGIKERQGRLAARRHEALTVLRRETELIAPAEVRFLAHALVVPSSDPEDRKRHDAAVEAVAVGVARAYEEAQGAEVRDVSTPPLARAAGLTDNPGFDIVSARSDGSRLAIEVKGRAGTGEVELTENEWAKACNLRDGYWLYAVYGCSTSSPQLLRVADPFGRLLAKSKRSFLLGHRQVVEASEP
jgi:hypothetical protein